MQLQNVDVCVDDILSVYHVINYRDQSLMRANRLHAKPTIPTIKSSILKQRIVIIERLKEIKGAHDNKFDFANVIHESRISAINAKHGLDFIKHDQGNLIINPGIDLSIIKDQTKDNNSRNRKLANDLNKSQAALLKVQSNQQNIISSIKSLCKVVNEIPNIITSLVSHIRQCCKHPDDMLIDSQSEYHILSIRYFNVSTFHACPYETTMSVLL